MLDEAEAKLLGDEKEQSEKEASDRFDTACREHEETLAALRRAREEAWEDHEGTVVRLQLETDEASAAARADVEERFKAAEDEHARALGMAMQSIHTRMPHTWPSSSPVP